MAKVKVHELAKELGTESKNIVRFLSDKGISDKTASSNVPEEYVNDIRNKFGKSKDDSDSAGSEVKKDVPEKKEAPKKKMAPVFRFENMKGAIPDSVRKKNKKPADMQKRPARKPKPDPVNKEAAKEKAPAFAKTEEPAQPRVKIIKKASEVSASVNEKTAVNAAPETPVRENTADLKNNAGRAQEQKSDNNSRLLSDQPLTRVKIIKPASENKVPAKKAAPRDVNKLRELQNKKSGKPSDTKSKDFANRRKFDKDKDEDREPRKGGPQGRNAGERGGSSQRQTQPSDGALAHKTSRDFRAKDKAHGKDDRKNFDRHDDGNDFSSHDKKKFNRIPKALQKQKPKAPEPEQKKEVITEIKIPETITIRDLCDKMKVQAGEIIKKLFLAGQIVTLNNEISYEKAAEIALDYNIIAELEEKEDVIAELLKEDEEKEEDLVGRPPVVCVMGHVDHGKTSILDAIRNTNVIAREAGGITQHIGAYQVKVDGQPITFLDTPGHEAFTAMRMRGANSTDIAILVVAADDGVKPQTVEAINHAKAAGVEIIVAINKMDKPAANIDKVKKELAEYDLIPEDWGGSTVMVPVSAKTQEGINDLLEMVLLTAEVLELKANPNRNARGIVIEAKLDKGRGPVATILIQKGTLKQGDFIACGACSGKVRAMNDENGKRLTKVTPSMPVEIIGLSDVPNAGEVLMSFDSDKEAKNFAATFVSEGKKSLIEGTQTQISLDDLYSRIQEGSLKELPLIVKADVQGSVEAVSQSLLKLTNDEVVVKVIHSAVGAINESDVDLAAASGAIIIGFNIKADAAASSTAEQTGVDIRIYNVIYQIIDDISRALKGMKAAVYEEKVIGHATIRQIFKSSGVGNIAGSYVTDGVFERDCLIRLFRKDQNIYTGKLASLKRFKDDVKEVREGFECGLVFDGFDSYEIDDVIEAYKMVEVVE